jgi:DNA-binding NarL/FixJ family response regulator
VTPGPASSISVFVAHPDGPVRRGLIDDLDAVDIAVVGEAGERAPALAGILEKAPDVALIAIDLIARPEADGRPSLCRSIRDALPVCHVLMVAEGDDDRSINAMGDGAVGCHLLDEPAVTLLDAIRGTARGEGLPPPSWARHALDQYRLMGDAGDRHPAPPELTSREHEVLSRLAAGMAPAAIAELHEVTVHLVRLHAADALEKLGRANEDERLIVGLP